ncbi:hypothetical protein Tco_0505343 [Tanacetum coccineum]
MMEIDNEQNVENKEFPSINDVFGTSIESQTYAKPLKHVSFITKVNFRTLEAPTYDGVDITICMSLEVEVNDRWLFFFKFYPAWDMEVMLENGYWMIRNIYNVLGKWSHNLNFTKVSDAFDVLSSMVDLDNEVGMNSNVPLIDKVMRKERKTIVRFASTKIVDSEGNCKESLLITTYITDEQYDYIVSPSTNIDVEDEKDDEDEMKILTWRRTRMTMRRVKMVDLKIIVYVWLFYWLSSVRYSLLVFIVM